MLKGFCNLGHLCGVTVGVLCLEQCFKDMFDLGLEFSYVIWN